jgi:hypothetical protein
LQEGISLVKSSAPGFAVSSSISFCLNFFTLNEVIELWKEAEIKDGSIWKSLLLEQRLPYQSPIRGPAIESNWERIPVHQIATLYRKKYKEKNHKTVLAFTGFRHRLMLPIYQILESLPSSVGEILVIYDPARAAFVAGNPANKEATIDLTRIVKTLLDEETDGELRVLGTSGGCLAAIAVGHALNAVSIGLVGPWYAPYLSQFESHLLRPKIGTSAFSKTIIKTGLNKQDLLGALNLRYRLPFARVRIFPTMTHNLMERQRRRGKLEQFLSSILEC